MDVIVDQLEGEYAIIELPNTTVIQAPRELFSNAQEGDVFTIVKNDDKTKERRNHIRQRFETLKKKPPDGEQIAESR